MSNPRKVVLSSADLDYIKKSKDIPENVKEAIITEQVARKSVLDQIDAITSMDVISDEKLDELDSLLKLNVIRPLDTDGVMTTCIDFTFKGDYVTQTEVEYEVKDFGKFVYVDFAHQKEKFNNNIDYIKHCEGTLSDKKVEKTWAQVASGVPFVNESTVKKYPPNDSLDFLFGDARKEVIASYKKKRTAAKTVVDAKIEKKRPKPKKKPAVATKKKPAVATKKNTVVMAADGKPRRRRR
ncbi:MAG: hypothetical protein CMK92_05040 [Pseudomonas sp.]|nr:hypothetical protein [Pseudomonas sp.]